MTDGWTAARHRTRPLQTRLVGSRFHKIVTPRLGTKRPLSEISINRQESPLSNYGFTKKPFKTSEKRKFDCLALDEVKDSQADSDNEPFMSSQEHLSQASSRHAELPRGGQVENTRRPYNDENSAIARHGIAPMTPTCTRSKLDAMSCDRPEDQQARRLSDTKIANSSPEVPSSVSWERIDFQPWYEESPVKSKKFLVESWTHGIYSPPASSPTTLSEEGLCLPGIGEKTVNRQLYKTPARNMIPLQTPPPTRETLEFHTDANKKLEIYSDDDVLEKRGVAPDHGPCKRLPLRELNSSFILTPASRQRDHYSSRSTDALPLPQMPILLRQLSTISRDDSPTEWFDARESLSPAEPQVDLARPESHRQGPILPDLSRQRTIEDSQFDDTFEPLSSEPCLPDGVDQRSDGCERFSWQQTNSMLNTLLPPGYTSSQYRSDPIDSMADPWNPLLSSTQDQELPSIDIASRNAVQHISSDAFSMEQDESLMHTFLPPPLFSLPSTAEE